MDLRLLICSTTAGDPAAGPEQSCGDDARPEGPEDGAGDETIGTADDSGGSTGCASSGCLGCGCASLVGLVVLTGIAGVVGFWQAPSLIGAQDWGEVYEIAEEAQTAVKAAGGATEGGGVAGQPTDRRQMAAEAPGVDRFFATLEETTLTEGDITGIRERLEEWEQSEPVADFRETHEALQGLEENSSGLEQLQRLRHLTQFVFRVQELGRAYHEDVRPDLGDKQRQLVAIVRVSQTGSEDHEPWSQTVADALVEDHDANLEDYRESRKLFEQIEGEEVDPQQLSEEEQRELAEAWSNQFVMITSAINRESLEAWQGLSDEERKAVVEQVDADHNWVARYAAAVFHGSAEGEVPMYFQMLGI